MPNLIKLREGRGGMVCLQIQSYSTFLIFCCVFVLNLKKGFNTPIQCFVTRFYKVKIYLNKKINKDESIGF